MSQFKKGSLGFRGVDSLGDIGVQFSGVLDVDTICADSGTLVERSAEGDEETATLITAEVGEETGFRRTDECSMRTGFRRIEAHLTAVGLYTTMSFVPE